MPYSVFLSRDSIPFKEKTCVSQAELKEILSGFLLTDSFPADIFLNTEFILYESQINQN